MKTPLTQPLDSTMFSQLYSCSIIDTSLMFLHPIGTCTEIMSRCITEVNDSEEVKIIPNVRPVITFFLNTFLNVTT